MTISETFQFKELVINFHPNKPNVKDSKFRGNEINQVISELLIIKDYNSLKELAFIIFEAAEEFRKDGEIEKAAHIESLLFNLKFFYKTNASDEILLENKSFYQRLEIAAEYKRLTNMEVHKGTPYAFLSQSYLLQGNIDWTFNFAHQAVEEDRNLSDLIANEFYFQTMPAFKTISFIEDKQNHMYQHIEKYILFIKNKIESYNNQFNRSFNYIQLTNNFLTEESFHDIKSFFTYNIAKIYELENLPSDNLKKNDFISIVYLNYIFNLALIVDKILVKKYNMEYIAGNIKRFCYDKFNFPRSTLEDLKRTYKLDQDLENRLQTLVNLDVPYSDGKLPLEVGTLFATWMLRNFGAHQMKCEEIIREQWKNIFQCLINSVFLIFDY